MFKESAVLCLVDEIEIVHSHFGVLSDPHFTVQPANTTVIAGNEATLNCAVAGLAEGATFVPTWLKSGQALTSGRDVGGHPRYSITGDPATEGNLHIQGVLLSDDAPYQCKLNIFGSNSNEAFLTVQVPPEVPVIDSRQNGSAITIQPPQPVVLACRANNAKPAATITWLKDGQPLVHDTPVIEVTPGGSEKLSSVSSTLTLNPEKEDNGIEYKCIVTHPALTSPYELSVSLNVQFAPGPPAISTSGFVEGMQVRAGTELTLTCVSTRGNPLADVYWWKDDVRLDFSYITDRIRSINEIRPVADRSDDGARYTCKATNVVQTEPLTAFVDLRVVYPPAFVNITGHEEMVKKGDIVTLTCKTAPSNPQASILWTGGGNNAIQSDPTVIEDPDGGYITTATLTLNMTGTADRMDILCQASNGNEIASTTAIVNVMYPPEPPQISAAVEGLRSGRSLRLSCSAFHGNPLADLAWYKNDEPVVASPTAMGPTIKSGSRASRDLLILVDKTDNGANYSCNATNAATVEPLQDVLTLSVHFPPDSIAVTAEPAAAKEGNNVTVTCETKSSNPASDVSWWRDGVAITGGEPNITDGEYGGLITRSELTVISVSASDNGAVFKCRASNEILTESTNDAVTLDIKYKPKISTASGSTIDTGEDFTTHTLQCAAEGNPETLTHTWHLNDAAIDVASNPRLTINDNGALVLQNLTRSDGGKYMCLVSNEEGNSNITATINVNYAPTISTTATITVTLYAVGEIVCEADAHPKPDNFLTWTRQGFDLSGFEHEYTEGKKIMRILNVSLADAGLYTCNANNGIEPSAKKDVQIIVQFKPQIDQSMPSKVAQTAGQTAILRCAAEGSPNVIFTWQKDGGPVNMTSDRYAEDTWKDVKYSNRYESRLIISHVNENFDYGMYECKAHNALGEGLFIVQLEKTSAPDAPSEPTVVRKTHDSITLSWKAGFDGGLDQTFTVRFSRKDSVQYQYVDVNPPNATIFTITNLSPGTEYEVTVRGKNILGPGPFYAGIINAVTEVEPTLPPGPPKGILVGDLPLYLFLLVVFLLLLSCVFLNIFLCCCLVKKRRAKKELADKSGVKLEKVRRGSQDSAPTESHSMDSLSKADSERDRGYSTEDDYDYDDRRYSDARRYSGANRDYDDRRYRDDYSDRDYSVSDRFDEDHRPIVRDRGSERMYREAEPGFYNTGYRPPSYAPSWDSYGAPPSISAMTADSRVSEEQDERDYIERLRRKQQEDRSANRVGALSGHRGSATPSPVPSSLGNFVQLSKSGRATVPSIAGSEDGFLV
ncbi:nephrin-like [Amphiura filiformis]|uniref:nephrin-like n=1 Tax=Amphiura filiformis TaxID=82378 RepID=UPI003B210FB9